MCIRDKGQYVHKPDQKHILNIYPDTPRYLDEYPLSTLYRYEHAQDLRVGRKAFLKAA